MSLDGLNYLLEKNEVVSTASALDLRERPEGIETGYLRHVRTFIPMSCYADSGTFSVADFEARLIKRTGEGKAPRGYIAAGYGYGKTSTALYLWQQAEAANLLTVPPFQLEKLPYLIEALYGWTRYRLSKKRPALIEELDHVYAGVVNRSLEGIAQKYGMTLESAGEALANGTLNLETQPNEYVNFFAAVTDIALRAGYSGIILIADEIQQFIRPRNEGRVDTISPLFNILQLLGTHEPDASLNFGFILSITLDEIAMIRDTHKRGDLLARLKELSIDLTDLYDTSFARSLWERMAQEFDFAAEAQQVIDGWTLEALGNLSANRAISDGPRTVVNVFKRAVTVYLERLQLGDPRPYSPIDMINDFLDEHIYFKGNDRVPSIARRMLAHPFVARDLGRYAPPIKLIAAFGVQGVPQTAQMDYEQADAIAELMDKTIGEIVRVGSNFAERSVALVGLDPETDPGWMKETIRNFRLGWNPHSRETVDRTFAAFTTVLTERVFPKAKLIETRQRNMVANHAVVLEMDVTDSEGRRYPKRRVHIRLRWDDEPPKDAGIFGDVCLEYHLKLYENIPAEQRKHHAELADVSPEPHTVVIPINLYYMPDDAIERPLYDQLKDVWSPYDLSPIILLNLYQLMVDLNNSGDMPENEARFIESSYLPEFLDFAIADMFNAQVGEKLESAGAEISVLSLAYLLGRRYPDYVTLMGAQTWATSLAKYMVALKDLNTLQRRGDDEVVGDKTEIAGRFTLSNTGFDSFVATFGSLLTVVSDFGGKKPGAVRFTLHPLESQVISWLQASDQTVQIGKHTARRIGRSQVVRWAIDLGYQGDEIEKALELLEVREVVSLTNDWIVEAINESVSLENLKAELRAHREEVTALAAAFPGESVSNYQATLGNITTALEEQAGAKVPDPAQLAKIDNTLKKNRRDAAAYAKDKRTDLAQRLNKVSVNGLRDTELIHMEQPMTDDIEYVDQVNALRVWLRDVILKTQRQVADHEAEVQRARSLLRPDVTIVQLGQISGILRTLESGQSTLQSGLGEAHDRLKDFERWHALVREGARVKIDLEDLRIDGTDPIRSDMKNLVLDVRAEISSRKLDALTLHQPFTDRLSEIKRELDRLRRNARAAFDLRRDAFVRVLQSMEAQIDPALNTLAFNPSDPINAYTILFSMARRQFTAAFETLQGYITARQQTTQVLQRQAAHLPSRESKALQQQADEIETLLIQLQERAAELPQYLAAIDTDDQLTQQAEPIAEAYRSARADASGLHRQLEQLRRAVTQLEPNAVETRLRDCLRSLTAESSATVDVFMLQNAYADDATFWTALRGLLEKDCIALSVTIPTNDFGATAS
jgi:uncharacterized protein YukE